MAAGGEADTVELTAGMAAITAAADWIDAWARAHELGADAAFAMRLCVEEAVTNIVSYAYDDDPGRHVLAVEAVAEAGGARVTIVDDGRPFDAAAAHDPGREGSIETATVGGRGIRLMRSFSRGLSHTRSAGRNRLSLTFAGG
jgi:anti-sigma regulatory factor (Ser/Thr protein kinase)